MSEETRWSQVRKDLDVKYELELQFPNAAPYAMRVGKTAFRCVRCDHVVPITECSNCGGTVYHPGRATSGQIGMFCAQCQKGLVRWTCPDCGTDNSVSKTVVEAMESGCFIATAAYGSPLAPEIDVLRRFRDTKMRPHRAGKWMIDAYERCSPPVADVIGRHPIARLWVRRVLLSPMIQVIQRRFLA